MDQLNFDKTSYLLCTFIIFLLAKKIQSTKPPDVVPQVLNAQAQAEPIRHEGETAYYSSRFSLEQRSGLFGNAAHTLKLLLDKAMAEFRSSKFLGMMNVNDISWKTYEQIDQDMRRVTSSLKALKVLVPRSGNASSFVGVYGTTCPLAMTVMLACLRTGLVIIPLSRERSLVSCAIDNSGLKVLFVTETSLEAIRSLDSPQLEYVISLGNVDDEAKNAAQEQGYKLLSYSEFLAQSNDSVFDNDGVAPDDIAAIYYSKYPNLKSRGAVLTHKNLLDATIGHAKNFQAQNRRLTSEDRLMNILYLDDVFGQVLVFLFATVGGSIVFLNKDSSSTQIHNADPTVVACDASYADRMKNRIEDHASSYFFKPGMAKKEECFNQGRLVNDTWEDMMVFREIREKYFGKRVRLLLIMNMNAKGSVQSTARFLRAVLGTQVLNVLSLCETSGPIAMTTFCDYTTDRGVFGPPLPHNAIKLIDSPSTGHLASDKPNPRGHLCIKGPSVLKGYWNSNGQITTLEEDEGKDNNNFYVDSDGWLHTNILAEICPNLTLKYLQ